MATNHWLDDPSNLCGSVHCSFVYRWMPYSVYDRYQSAQLVEDSKHSWISMFRRPCDMHIVVIFATSMYLLFAGATGPSGGSKYTRLLGSVVFLSGVALFITGFVYFRDGHGAAIYFNDNANLTETVGDVFLGFALVIGDSMIIYRLWVVWSYSKIVIILPSLSLLGLFRGIDNKRTERTYTVQHFMAVVVESAAIYTVAILYYTITHQLGSNLQYIAVGALPSLSAIANGLIHVRLGLGRTIEQIAGANGSTAVSGPIRFKSGQSGTRSGGLDTGEASEIKMQVL
ncbi:hypothetical protein B0H15DRAFT_803387 [Mycena belliarum]|uniref:Uncharacterized protein n=1 Tax=Mycena belliarum TaxID=1033014 RepID=A0AAD6U0K8_9AGAR|nr:hypothetical protein B0H15DRAFT_803387 [Mycena belliae]